MGAMVDMPARDALVNDNAIVEYKSAFTELYVFSQLKTIDVSVYYYSPNDSAVEIDFVVQRDAHIIPIEAKAEVMSRLKLCVSLLPIIQVFEVCGYLC